MLRYNPQTNSMEHAGNTGGAAPASVHNVPLVLATAAKAIVTGHDLTASGAKLRFTFRDGANPKRPWPDLEIDLDVYKANTAAFQYLGIFDNDHIRIYLDDLATGAIRLSAHGRVFEYVKSELIL